MSRYRRPLYHYLCPTGLHWDNHNIASFVIDTTLKIVVNDHINIIYIYIYMTCNYYRNEARNAWSPLFPKNTTVPVQLACYNERRRRSHRITKWGTYREINMNKVFRYGRLNWIDGKWIICFIHFRYRRVATGYVEYTRLFLASCTCC